jgi:hypothetical protein
MLNANIKTYLRNICMGVGLATVMTFPALGQTLPAPYVSRALDALMISVDDQVRSTFNLNENQNGVMVLATAPGGVAESAGLIPGDIIETAYGQNINEPIKLDQIVYYWLNKGVSDFGFDVWQNGSPQYFSSAITPESYSEVIDVVTITTWTSYSSESFSYEEYTSEYSSEITESYESSESLIEEAASSEEFESEQTQEASEYDANLDTDQDGTPDVADTDDDNDGEPDMVDSDDNGDGAEEVEEE